MTAPSRPPYSGRESHPDEIERLERLRSIRGAMTPLTPEEIARNDRRALVMHMLSFARTYSAFDLDVLHEATQKDLQDADSLRVEP